MNNTTKIPRINVLEQQVFDMLCAPVGSIKLCELSVVSNELLTHIRRYVGSRRRGESEWARRADNALWSLQARIQIAFDLTPAQVHAILDI